MHRYLPDHDVQALKYFTARVKYTSHDPSKTLRQSTYLRALSTLPEVQIICGRFKKRHVRGPRCFYDRDKKMYIENGPLVTIRKWEEKESDVNIATHMMFDAPRYECIVLVSNDTDLKTPLWYVKHHFKKRIGIISPKQSVERVSFYHRAPCHRDLIEVSHFQKRISNKALQECQFPFELHDKKGSFFCPPSWQN